MVSSTLRAFDSLIRLSLYGQRTVLVELAAFDDEPVSDAVIKYMNRLSDFLFVAARYASDRGKGDVLWVPGQNR